MLVTRVLLGVGIVGAAASIIMLRTGAASAAACAMSCLRAAAMLIASINLPSCYNHPISNYWHHASQRGDVMLSCGSGGIFI